MRHLLREQGLEDEIEIDSAGTGGWHAGDPPDARATEAARAARDRARGRRAPGAPERLRATTTCCSPPTARTSPTCARSRPTRRRGRRCGCCASSTRRRPATSTCPTPTTAARTASRTCSTSSRRPAAGLLDEVAVSLEAAIGAAAGSPVAARRRVAGGSINEALRGRARRRPPRVREDPRATPAGRVRGRGRVAGVAGRARRACGCPR